MKIRFIQFFALALLFVAAPRTLALDGVVIAHEGAAAANLTASALKDILTGKTMYWDGGEAIVIVYVEQADAALKEASGMDSSAFKTFWQRLAFSGRAKPPKKADDVAAAVAAVAATKGAIAVVTSDAALSGVKKIEVK